MLDEDKSEEIYRLILRDADARVKCTLLILRFTQLLDLVEKGALPNMCKDRGELRNPGPEACFTFESRPGQPTAGDWRSAVHHAFKSIDQIFLPSS